MSVLCANDFFSLDTYRIKLHQTKPHQRFAAEAKKKVARVASTETMNMSLDLGEHDFGRPPDSSKHEDDDEEGEGDKGDGKKKIKLDHSHLSVIKLDSNGSNISLLSDMTGNDSDDSLLTTEHKLLGQVSANMSGVVSTSNLEYGTTLASTPTESRYSLALHDINKKHEKNRGGSGYETMYKMSHIKVTDGNRIRLRNVNTNLMKKIEYINAGGDLSALWKIDCTAVEVPWHVSESFDNLPYQGGERENYNVSSSLTAKVGKHVPAPPHQFEPPKKEEKHEADMSEEEYYFHQL